MSGAIQQGGPASGSGPRTADFWCPDPTAGIGGQVLQLPLLPFRILGLSLQGMAQAAQALASALGLAGPAAAAAAVGAGGGTGRDLRQATFAGGAASGGAAADRLETPKKEDKKMTTCCEPIPNDCDSFQVVAYSIISVDPNFDGPDEERLLVNTTTAVVSGSLTEDQIPAYAIAASCDEIEGKNAQYLRVCFQVQCRYVMPCRDYDKQQAKALRSIAASLAEATKDKDKDKDKKLTTTR
jgi:hypothetical protein